MHDAPNVIPTAFDRSCRPNSSARGRPRWKSIWKPANTAAGFETLAAVPIGGPMCDGAWAEKGIPQSAADRGDGGDGSSRIEEEEDTDWLASFPDLLRLPTTPPCWAGWVPTRSLR